MFKNQFQGGPFVEVFSAQGKNPGAKWKIFGSPSAIWKEYDKEVKGFVFILEGSSQINKMQLPKETRQTLGLIQQFLTLQLFVPLGQDFSAELLITDLGNIKRRLYLSTVHKELSVTPLHAKIPLFTIKRNIWCNMCIDLVAFTNEIFGGAVFQSLDGIIISANCKLRKIFTLKSKPRDTAEEDDRQLERLHDFMKYQVVLQHIKSDSVGLQVHLPDERSWFIMTIPAIGLCVPFVPCEPTDAIPRTCQLNTDVPQVTQVLNLTKIHKPEIKCRRHPVTVQETGSLVNREQGNIHSSKTRDVSHIAFGSKILGPPPSSNRKVNTKVSAEVTKTWGSKSNRSCQLQNSGKGTESVEDIERWELSFSPCNGSLDQGGKRNTDQTTGGVSQNGPEVQIQKTSESGQPDFQLTSPQGPSANKNSHRSFSLKNAARNTWEITSDEWVFPESFTEGQLDRSEQLIATEDWACRNLTSPQDASEHHGKESGDHQASSKEIFTFSSSPQSAPHGKSPNLSPESCLFPLDLKQDSNRVHGQTQIEENFEGTDSSEEDDNSEFIQGTENLEISRNRQGPSDPAEIPWKRMSWRNEYWKNKGHSKHNVEETVLSEPQSSPGRKPGSDSSQKTLKPTLSLSPTGSKSDFFKAIPYGSEKTEGCEGVSGQLKGSVSKKSLKKISREDSCLSTQTREYDWKNYQSSRLSPCELQMLASMERQQNEELRDAGISHGLSASQIDNCNVSISASSDDTETWNSCFPPPVSQEHHYQKEMSPLSHSNPRFYQVDTMKLAVQVHPEASAIATCRWMFTSAHNILLELEHDPGFLLLSHVNQSAHVALENLAALGAGSQRNHLCPHELLQGMKWTQTPDCSPQSDISAMYPCLLCKRFSSKVLVCCRFGSLIKGNAERKDWSNVFSPPIIPGSQELEEHSKSSTHQSIPGEDDPSAEDDEEVLNLLYDPCLNCYFDPNSGKYYELA